MTFGETIAALATPPGIGGIGVIRVSGPAAAQIARRLFRPAQPRTELLSHRLYHGQIIDPESGAVLDDVLVALMWAPRSYTGEDTLEISCHGGPLILCRVLEAVLRAGARPAARGEFTQRAFLNGRLDLSQAEAVLDAITARTCEGLAAALERLHGGLSRQVETLRSRIIDLLAGIEASIDFAAEDGGEEEPGGDLSAFDALLADLTALASTYRRGRILREGLGVVIVGRPNVGKSSLLNRLLGVKRAIVAPLPGTTRDFIEETLDIGGIPVRLTDTAGIHPPRDAIEAEGIGLVWERLASADAVLLLLDGSAPLTAGDGELLADLGDRPLIAAINKADLPQQIDAGSLAALLPAGLPPPLMISARTGQGIDGLLKAIAALAIATPAEEAPGTGIAHLRHKIALEKAAEALRRARQGLSAGLPPELTALEIREALGALGEITGRTSPEEVLERVFANFCIGK
jgi:tRNA modification GTPase